jgi:HK97 family phage major capsid protein
MSEYDKLINSGNVLFTPDELAQIFQDAEKQSEIMRLGRRLRDMTTNELKLKVSTALPEVYFVGTKGESQTFPSSALKQTTKSEWDDVSIYAGELAAITVVPNNTFNDANFDIFGEVKRQFPSAIARKVDASVLYGTAGTDVPDDWSNGIYTDMPLGNVISLGGVGDLYDDLLGEGGVFAAVEAGGYDVNGQLGATVLKSKLRGLRDGGSGLPLFSQSMQSVGGYTLAGIPIDFPTNGGFNPATTLLIAGDWSKLVWSLRQDVAFDVFTTGVVQAANGAITHNLMQEDLTAIRCTFRMAWGLPDPEVARWDASIQDPYPFAALTPEGESIS